MRKVLPPFTNRSRHHGVTPLQEPDTKPPLPTMNKLIAYCGLDCEKCEARIATVNQDESLREKVAKKWSELNGVEITPAMINCVGCRVDGVKTPYCETMCPIRQCAQSRQVETCAECAEMEACPKLAQITDHSDEARRNLRDG